MRKREEKGGRERREGERGRERESGVRVRVGWRDGW
jgi:hypothetical protein